MKKAIDQGMKSLFDTQKADGSWEPYGAVNGNGYVAPTAFAVYALLEGGASMEDKRIKAALDWLVAHDTNYTYELGIRCNTWLLAARKDHKYLKNLEADMKALLDLCQGGGYSYGGVRPIRQPPIIVRPPPIKVRGPGNAPSYSGWGDNSNSQYGLLGVWAASRDERIEDIPESYWATVLQFWLGRQEDDGGWGYGPRMSGRGFGAMTTSSRGTMTCAGIASVLVCLDNLNFDDCLHCKVGENAAAKAAQKGLDWLAKSFSGAGPGNLGGGGYYYYGVERVGLASGMRCFGTVDWYNTLCPEILATQGQDGSFRGGYGGVIETSYCLLFLIRGNAPILINKLQFTSVEDGQEIETDWKCRPRDIAHLCAWLGRLYEKEFNWQVVNFKTPVAQWHDAADPLHLRRPQARLHRRADPDASRLRLPGRHDLQLRRVRRQGLQGRHARGVRQDLPGLRTGRHAPHSRDLQQEDVRRP